MYIYIDRFRYHGLEDDLKAFRPAASSFQALSPGSMVDCIAGSLLIICL